MKDWNIQLFELNYNSEEADAIAETLKTGWITSGPRILAFEKSFEDFSNSTYKAVAVSSCTAALHLSLLAADVRAGDEVVVSALTFVAAANVVRHVGGKVVLADSKSEVDWNVSLENIVAVTSEKTKAVIVVHFAGKPCTDIAIIADYCSSNGIVLIEDVAHAPGAAVSGQQCGTFGNFGCFSFFTNKNISMGEGGLVLCKTASDHERISRLRSHGMTVSTLDRYRGKALSYDVAESGLNYRLDEMRAALGLVQLKKFVRAQEKREWLVNRYAELLEESNLLELFKFETEINTLSAYHIFPILLSPRVERIDFMQYLKSCGIQTSIHYPPLSSFSGLRGHLTGEDRVARNISEREVTLPLHTKLEEEDICYISRKINEYVNV